MTPAERLNTMQLRLTAALTPRNLEIIDESHLHIGHAGARSGAGHYKVRINSEQFAGKTKIVAHQMVYNALQDLMEKEIHALQIEFIDPKV